MRGEVDASRVGVQLYEPRTGNFSKPLIAESGSDPVDAMLDLLPSLATFVTDTGSLRTDRVSHQVLALKISDNMFLSRLLLDPEPVATGTVGPESRRSRWYIWAGVAALSAGGATGLALALTRDPEGGGATGTIVVGPYP